MLMDISNWTLYNPKIVLDHTSKKFFGKYLYKLIVFCPGGRAIDSKRSIVGELEHRRLLSANISGWWGERLSRNLDRADADFLQRMRTLRLQRLPDIKMRIEEPRIQIYAESESDLTKIVQTYFQPTDYKYVESITGPEDSKAETVLNSGGIIRKRDIGYTHKVILRDGKYSQEIRTNLLNYITSMGLEMVKIHSGLEHMLHKPSGYIWNCYFYTNDPSVTTFINLIHPGLVSNIHELVVLPDK